MSAGVRDLLVVGGGSAGLVAARTAASLGASVLLVERDRPGGDCLWRGCVPSKALLAAAGVAAAARDAGRFGISTGPVEVEFTTVMAHVRSAIATIEPVDSPDAIRAAGAGHRAGTARFTGPGTAEVDGVEVRFRRALVATGSAPAPLDLPVDGAAPTVLTTDTVWDLEVLPERLVVLGGGPVGCELGQAFARLGSRVTLVEAAGRLLPGEDPDASALVDAALVADGVDVRSGTRARALGPARVELEDGAAVDADVVLIALGRRPRTAGLGLETVGVELTRSGAVGVDEHLRTSNPAVFAAGDVTDHPRFTHVAGTHGALAAANAVLGLRRRVDPVVPRVTFTAPEVASVGAATGHTVRTVGHAEVDRAVTDAAPAGFSRLVLDRRGRVTGATVVGPRAGEALAELTLAVRRGLRATDLAGTTHPYPTWGDGPWNAAVADVRARLATRPARAALRAVVAARRRARPSRRRSRPEE